MLPPTLWVEIIIAGFVYLLAGFFFILTKAGPPYNLDFLANWKDISAIVSIIIVFTSYILGLLAHRLLQFILLYVVEPIIKKLNIKFNVIGDARKDYFSLNFILHQYGSQYLHREIDLQYSAFALFSSLIFSLPLLGWSLSRWLLQTNNSEWSSWALWICIGLAAASLLVNFRQRKNFNGIRDEAFRELMKLHKKNLGEKTKKKHSMKKSGG
ncbi:MAG: hypothetical protein H6634_05380 [Anaerolineales bacterium]|nr:hypothetical protein [Anaerolineales bacterium]